MQTSSSRKQLWYVVLYSSTAAVGGFLFGFDSAVINGTVDALGEAFSSSSVAQGFSVASMLIGCAAGALAAGTVADRLGRRPVMFASAIAFLISALGSGWSSSSQEFVVYRLLGGLAVGAASVIAPAYIAEIAPARMRGRLASLQQMAIVLGIFVAFLSNYAIVSLAGSAGSVWLAGRAAWSWMFWMEAIPSAAYFLLLLLIPESPRFLVARGRDSQARSVLGRVVDADEADQLVRSIRSSLHGERKASLRELFKPGSYNLLPIVWIGIILAALQQLTGINIIMYYGAVLWQACGFSESHSLLINVLSGTINISSTLVAIALVDKLGRKPLLLAGSILMTASLFTVAIVFARADATEAGTLTLNATEAWTALIGAHMFLVGFATTWGPCVWVLLSEVFNNRIRGSAMALATGSLWLTNFTITMLFPPMLDGIGLAATYLIFTAIVFFSFFFVLRFIDETKGKTLEDIGEELQPTGLPA